MFDKLFSHFGNYFKWGYMNYPYYNDYNGEEIMPKFNT